jgi:uncharacterized protein (DUF2252 family)
MNRELGLDHASAERRMAWGRSLRDETPRRTLGEWSPPSDRPDPVETLVAQNRTRVQRLVPIRHERMLQSPFAFYRGGAAIMAADLASTPVTGLTAQICGDAHLANFGVFGSPERALVFDANDFDETHPGPWEWDVKRLAVSAVLLGRDRGWPVAEQERLARVVGAVYRMAMADMASKSRLDVWYSRMTDQEILSLARSPKALKTATRSIEKARRNDVSRAVAKFTEERDGRRRFINSPPLLVRLDELFPEEEIGGIHADVLDLFGQYLESLPEHMRVLVGGYELLDIAFKVVGVGSVGTRCLIALAYARDLDDLFIFQVKEAQQSVLRPFVDPVDFGSEGRRVVLGQHLMQAASDQFLGWATVRGHDYYLRQFRDMKGSADLASIPPDASEAYLALCAWTLARAHARSGDRLAIAGYLGSGDRFDRAILEFSTAYADQVAEDYERFAEAAASGAIPVATDPSFV